MCLSVLIVYCNPAPAYLLLTDNGMKRGANRCHKVLAGSAAWAVWRKWWLTGVVAHLVALPLHGWWLQRRALVIFLKWHDEVCFFVIDGCDLIRSTLFIIFDILLIILYIVLYWFELYYSIQMQGFFDGFEGLQAPWRTLPTHTHTHDLVCHASTYHD